MADSDYISSQILSNIEDLDITNSYCLYQRRYPRRLPKLDDSPKKSPLKLQNNPSPKKTQKEIPQKKKLKSVVGQTLLLDEAMPLNNDEEDKNSSDCSSIRDEVKNLSLEDFNDEEEENVDIELAKPVSLTNFMGSKISLDDAKKRVESARNACASLLGNYNEYCRSTARRSATPKSPARASVSIDPKFLGTRKGAKVGVGSQRIGSGKQQRVLSFADPPPGGGGGGGGGRSARGKHRSLSLADGTQGVGRRGRNNSVFTPSAASGKRSLSISSTRSPPRRPSISPQLQREILSPLPTSPVPAVEKKPLSPATQARLHRRHTMTFNAGEFNGIILQKNKKNARTVTPEIVVDEPKEPEPEAVKKSSKELFFSRALERDKQMEWLESDDFPDPPVQVVEPRSLKGDPISYQVARSLRMLLFGSCSVSFSNVWREQMLIFFKPDYYALKFHKDGPVEVMASLQAYVLKNLLFMKKNEEDYDAKVRLSPSYAVQQQLLCSSICDMIWCVGEGKHGVAALPIGKCTFTPEFDYKNDEITEKMELFKFVQRQQLEKFVMQNITKFQDYYGCISLLYSLMLSRGLTEFRSDCSEIQHGVLEVTMPLRCQPIINLCIHGRAVPNIFNNDMEVFNEQLDRIDTHKGIDRRCNFGFLTHAEFLDPKSVQVGSCLKTPLFPIWVANNNSTLCVLFSLKRGLLSDWKLERRFQLYVFHGIPRHVVTNDVDVRLTIDTIQTLVVDTDEEEVSTLEETIRTKWTDSVIEWNGFARF